MNTQVGDSGGPPTEAYAKTALASGPGLPDAPAALAAGTQIGHYRILEMLGSGGMGEVYRAEQLQPVRRTVALKVLSSQRLDARHQAYFEIERQLLARMQHPCIAQIFDAGTLPDGSPYFAMEYIDGEPITAWCSHHRLPFAQRVALFVQVCEGVQHAHAKGVIHRDIKPGNILVTEVDGRPVPKIIDFGIAMLTQRGRGGESEDVAGTPEYMSPEQAEGMQDIDARSDVYSLGVVLYELLTGHRPSVVATAGVQLRAGLETTLRPPSAMVPDQGSVPDDGALGLSRTVLKRTLHAEFDWVILRALRHDREARYATPTELANELRRWQNHRPMLAVPPSPRYVWGKYVRRHRLALAAASAVLLSLAVGVGLLVFGLMEARAQRALAEQRQHALEQVTTFQSAMLKDIDVEAMGARLMRLQREQLEATDPARAQTFEQLASGIGATDVARRLIDDTLLAPSARAIERDFTDSPKVAAELQETLGDIYQKIGLHAEAETRFLQALALSALSDPIDVSQRAELIGALTHSQIRLGKLAVAGPELDEAEKLIADLDEIDPGRVAIVLSRALYLDDAGQREEGVAVLATLHQTLAEQVPLSDERRRTVANNYAIQLARVRRYDQARPLLEALYAEYKATLGESHPDTAGTLSNLSGVIAANNDLDTALPLLRASLGQTRARLGDTHLITLGAINNLGITLIRTGDFGEARALLEEALAARRRVLGETHPLTLRSMHNLASLLNAAGEPIAATSLQSQVVALRRTTLGEDHPDTLASVVNLATTARDAGEYTLAREAATDALTRCERVFGTEHVQTAEALAALASVEVAAGNNAEAERLSRQALAQFGTHFGPDNPLRLQTAFGLYRVLDARKDSEAPAVLDTLRSLVTKPEADLGPGMRDLRRQVIAALKARGETLPAADPPG